MYVVRVWERMWVPPGDLVRVLLEGHAVSGRSPHTAVVGPGSMVFEI
jgi:hypothetical protein